VHPEVRAFIRSVSRNYLAHRVVELGSLDVVGTIRDLFGEAESYVGVDVVEGPSVDVVANAAYWQPDIRPDMVLCCEVLEHASEAAEIINNAWLMLLPGGIFVVTAAATGRQEHSAIDGLELRPGEYYRNVDPVDLRSWLQCFEEVEAFEYHPDRGDVYAVARKQLCAS